MSQVVKLSSSPPTMGTRTKTVNSDEVRADQSQARADGHDRTSATACGTRRRSMLVEGTAVVLPAPSLFVRLLALVGDCGGRLARRAGRLVPVCFSLHPAGATGPVSRSARTLRSSRSGGL